MPLLFTGEEFSEPEFEHVYPAEAVGSGARVKVLASAEVVSDQGEAAVKDKASDKFDRLGEPGRVSITTADFG